METILAMLYVLLGFSVIVSLFGMVNTMVLSVFERTREIGMLRTIGMTRRQARRMIRHESIITALIGSALGLGLGLFLSGARHPGDVGLGLAFAFPSRRWRVHAGRDHRGHRRGDHAGTASLAAQRARRAAVRVAGNPQPAGNALAAVWPRGRSRVFIPQRPPREVDARRANETRCGGARPRRMRPGPRGTVSRRLPRCVGLRNLRQPSKASRPGVSRYGRTARVWGLRRGLTLRCSGLSCRVRTMWLAIEAFRGRIQPPPVVGSEPGRPARRRRTRSVQRAS